MVIAGYITFIVAPDDRPSLNSRVATAINALPTIVLDPGHGGIDDGAKAHGLVEKELTLDVAERVERFLQAFGFRTVLTRRDNATTLSLPQRAAIANQHEHSLFVSLHFDQASHSGATGVAVFYPQRKVAENDGWTWAGFFDTSAARRPVEDEALAGYIQAAMLGRMEANNRGITARDLYVVRHVNSPAVLIEGGFLSNTFDARLLGSPEYRDRLAASVVEGILTYHKMQPRSPEPAQLANVGH
jgi:N-acetylmuramoyl-L-alanine amidase